MRLITILYIIFTAGFLNAQSSDISHDVKSKMLSEPAPDFAMQNMEGTEVTLESLKGKIIVLDFWATWCPPCKASFPGMQKAEAKYKNDENVVFYYVNTRERGEDKVEKVRTFLSQKGYNFNVLFDLDKTVYNAFGPRGIPAKYIIDEAGNIRFKSIGYRGNEEDLIAELTEMIEAVKSE